jgi:hypothetical protein
VPAAREPRQPSWPRVLMAIVRFDAVRQKFVSARQLDPSGARQRF